MSNVLIGIIGVILFIGLALAGALFLGPRFQEATNNSKAAAVVQSLKQTTDAVNLYELNQGETMLASTSSSNMRTLANTGYLKSAITNPFNNEPIWTVDPRGNSSATRVDHVYTELGKSESARSICIAIERQAGNKNPNIDTQHSWEPYVAANKRVGCFASEVGGSLYAYAPL